MAFIVEDGSGIKDANSYATVQGYKDYLKERGTTVTSGGSTIQSALIQATDYIDVRNCSLFRGQKAFLQLCSRSIYTMTGQPADGETITIGAVTYTYKTTLTEPADETEIEIKENLLLTLNNTASVIANSDNEDVFGVTSDQVDTMHVFTSRDGIVTTTTAANSTFDVAASQGFSAFAQPRQFPRANLFDQNTGQPILGIPTELVKATYEYAKRALSAPLMPDPTVDTSGAKVTERTRKVGPIETINKFDGASVPKITKPYPAADLLLIKFLMSTGGVIRN